MLRTNRERPTAAAPAIARKAESSNSSRRMSNLDRSSYFARREAAKVLRTVLQGDARRKAIGSIKSLVYSPSIRNKKATFALVCQTLKYLPLIKDILAATNILNGKWKAILFAGAAEKFLLLQKNALQTALARLCVRQKVKNVQDLLTLYNRTPVASRPRYVRVNSLKMNVESALQELGKVHKVSKDDMVPDLLVLPSGTDLHNHPLVMNGSVFLQGKASCMVAVSLGPEPGWEVLDACAAPGNKTVHLAALMRGKGKIIACELNKDRVKHLEDTIKRSGAPNIDVLHDDFLNINIQDSLYSKVRAILLDPSCSGSGMAAERLDHLLPSYTAGESADMQRVKKLAAFQKRALEHALSFPAVERVVYSTCSIHQEENEDVVKSVLPLAAALNFQLATPFPQWPRRGLPVFEGSEHLLRMDLAEDMEGFFIALFIRKNAVTGPETAISEEMKASKMSTRANSINVRSKNLSSQRNKGRPLLHPRKKISCPLMTSPFLKMLRMSSHGSMVRKRTSEKGSLLRLKSK
ncbi:25S rRNA (cytosine-C(5))-methyltransferase NSUN5 isoform X2 [Magnolia sinica]|uniref:25S rRNA (cytosine-C(5))-methyltransferase NSUN5 isoform X2 n=1 Tax=Magnolia sinica TaxID=86752 RepID=UPI0026584EA4|nr:25S rRNA (cytosine-C(5))-methyltransferase NSUN5 isoform X2 [Magnolia sinica]